MRNKTTKGQAKSEITREEMLERAGISEDEAERWEKLVGKSDKEIEALALAECEARHDAIYARLGLKNLSTKGNTKTRNRRTKEEMNYLRDQIVDVLQSDHPQTVRGVFYRCEVRSVVKKTESGVRAVQRQVLKLRREGVIPYSWIVDSGRWVRSVDVHSSLEEFLQETMSLYRKDLWAGSDVNIEIWCEKEALAGLLYEETSKWRVNLMAGHGFNSESYLYEVSEQIKECGKPTYIYYFGDYDPSGELAYKHLERRLREFVPDIAVHFEKVAVTPEQIKKLNLPTRPTKRKGNMHAKSFKSNVSVELDAIPAQKLRELVSDCIQKHIDAHAWNTTLLAEVKEREMLEMFANNFIDGMQ